MDVYSTSDLLTRDEMDAMRSDVETYLGEYDGSKEAVQEAVDAKQ